MSNLEILPLRMLEFGYTASDLWAKTANSAPNEDFRSQGWFDIRHFLTFSYIFLTSLLGLVEIGWRITRRYKAEVEKAEVQPLNSKKNGTFNQWFGQNPKQFGFFKRLEFDGIFNINRWCRIFVHVRSNKSPCLAVRKRATSEIYSVRDWGCFFRSAEKVENCCQLLWSTRPNQYRKRTCIRFFHSENADALGMVP